MFKPRQKVVVFLQDKGKSDMVGLAQVKEVVGAEVLISLPKVMRGDGLQCDD